MPPDQHARPPVLVPKPVEIFNGAQCRGYCWAQTHADLEVRIKLAKATKDINVILSATSICVSSGSLGVLVNGQLEHPISTESAYWLLQRDNEPTIVIYLDKQEDLWWKQLLLGEQPIESGPRNYTVPMEQLDEGSRMAIDRLITKQKVKFARHPADHQA